MTVGRLAVGRILVLLSGSRRAHINVNIQCTLRLLARLIRDFSKQDVRAKRDGRYDIAFFLFSLLEQKVNKTKNIRGVSGKHRTNSRPAPSAAGNLGRVVHFALLVSFTPPSAESQKERNENEKKNGEKREKHDALGRQQLAHKQKTPPNTIPHSRRKKTLASTPMSISTLQTLSLSSRPIPSSCTRHAEKTESDGKLWEKKGKKGESIARTVLMVDAA